MKLIPSIVCKPVATSVFPLSSGSSAIAQQTLLNANRIASRVDHGVAAIGRSRIAAPEYAAADNMSGTAYIRPHDLDIVDDAAHAAFSTRVEHIVKLGSTVRLELIDLADGKVLEVELPRERFDELDVAAGSTIHLSARRARVFIEAAAAGKELA